MPIHYRMLMDTIYSIIAAVCFDLYVESWLVGIGTFFAITAIRQFSED